MRTNTLRYLRPLLGTGIFLLLPAAMTAQDEEVPDEGLIGVDHSIEAINESGVAVEERLLALLDELPEEARAGIERAIQANRDGRQEALDVLQDLREQGEAIDPESRTDAGEALAEAFVKAEQALLDAEQNVPEQARPRVTEAFVHLRDGTDRAFEAAGLERPARLERPERPETVQRPERPERAERPDRPGRPGAGGGF